MESKTIEEEKLYLVNTLDEIKAQIKELGANVTVEEENITEFNRYIFKEMGSMDKVEIQSNLLSSAMEEDAFIRKSNYLKKLYRIRHNPYFGRIDITSDKDYKIYIGITYLEKNNKHLIYDWRSPVANIFYESEHGHCSYIAPEGKIDCYLNLKRQYKISNDEIINIFDNDTNINDEVLQSVLSSDSSDKMKNIVNTIQKEQNNVIRDTDSKNMIVSGIAGSGKTSVALHRIAYLLYKIPNLSSSNILIFSPNNIFSLYISNVLPTLGEDNTKETTFSSFCSDYIREYKSIESFTNFISRFYTKKDNNRELIKFKQSDQMSDLIDEYICKFTRNIRFNDDFHYLESIIPKEDLNDLFQDRYSKLSVFDRFNHLAEYICNFYAISIGKNKRTFVKKLMELCSFDKNLKHIYENFYRSDTFIKNFRELSEREIKEFINAKEMYFEDSSLFIYMKGLLYDFPYSNLIEQVVVDEAQDYTRLQYKILKKIFKKASFTILGDVNQTINPYYKYDSLEDIGILFNDYNYVELTKTYRSSKEIIDFSNKILNLDYAVSIRKSNNTPVLLRNNLVDDISKLKEDIKYLQSKYKKVCIITKDNLECNNLYELLKDSFDITNMLNKGKYYNPYLIIVPSFLAKGLEFDSVIIYNKKGNSYKENEKYLYYVAVTRSMHELIVYNN